MASSAERVTPPETPEEVPVDYSARGTNRGRYNTKVQNPKAANDNHPAAANDNNQTRRNSDKSSVRRNAKRILRTRRKYRGAVNKIGSVLGIEQDVNVKRIRAAAASWMIVVFIAPFTLLHFVVWGIGVLALGTEGIPVVNWVLPGEEMFFLTTGILALLGFLYMFFALAVYLARGIDCFSGWKGLIFIACLTGHFAPFFNFFPYVFLWCIAVVMGQNETTED